MSNLLSSLEQLDVSSLTYEEWIRVGMGLHAEGLDCSVWENWSRNDSRFHPGECQRKWRTFKGSADPVTGASIVQMAKERGRQPFEGDGIMAWDDVIQYDGDDFTAYTAVPDNWDPVSQLTEYLELLFEPDDLVSYVSEAWQDDDGKWKPSGAGCYDRTAAQLISALKRHPDDIGATIGDWKKDAGAWIRFNPVNGEGVKNEHISRYRYALVESDSMTIADQDAMYRKLELPIVCMVHSGGKSLHAIVRVDAEDYTEYRKRVEFLYDFLERNGVRVDKQNRNPSRLSRMPGVTRGGNRQYIVAKNLGRRSWVEWLDFVEGVSDELPDMVALEQYKDNPPELPEALIDGVLRRGHKMLISGSSKAGKSFLLMELAVSIAEGIPWLGFDCRKGRVLYVNLEIDPASCITRFMKIYEAKRLPMKAAGNIVVWNLRGHAVPLDKLVPKLIRRVRDQGFDAIIVDPIYKVITGDENNASDMAAFCNQFDRICTETGCSVIYCHHHSKGAQGSKRAIDRASGSGVFARDPDAQLDMIQLELTDDLKNNVADDGATAWRLECSLREFAPFPPRNFWFEYPLHELDTSGTLAAAFAEGSPMANLTKSRKYTTADERKASLDTAYDVCNMGDPVTVKDIAGYLDLTERCIRDRLKEFEDEYWVHHGIVVRKTPNGNAD